MKFLLDTNILSDARRRQSTSLMTWLEHQQIDDLAVSVITILELERGIRSLERRDPEAGTVLRHWLDDDVRAIVRGRILPVDNDVAVAAAALHIPDPLPDLDALIAATAIVHGLTLVTRNTKDFARTGVPILNPWEA